MIYHHRSIAISFAVVSLVASGCKKKPPVASAPPPAVVPSTVNAQTDDDPMLWPITVKLGTDGRAVPETSRLTPRQQDKWMAGAEWQPDPHGMFIANPSATYRQPFKTIVRGPGPKSVQKGGGKTHSVGSDGSRSEFDADSGSLWTWDSDGGVSVWDGGNGTFTYRAPDGTVSQTGDVPGQTITTNPDGSKDIRNEDGSGAHLNGPQEAAKEGAPIGYTYGPDGPDGERTTIYDDGGSVELPTPLPGGGSGPGGDRLSNGVGEPHYNTSDGTAYTTQAAGEFVLVTGVPGREVQARHEPWKGSESFSAITAMAFRVGESKIEIRLDGTVLLDGTAAPDGSLVQGDITGGGAVGVWRKAGVMKAAVVIWPDLSAVWLLPRDGWLDFHLQWRGEAPTHRGLLGSNDGDAANDLTGRDGTIATNGGEAELVKFVNSWRITAEESLFTYKPGQSVATFALMDFPRQPAKAQYAELAEECCKDLPEGTAKRQCFYDVSMTGDRSFADSYRELLRRQKAVAARAQIAKKPAPAASGGIILTEEEQEKATAVEVGATIQETLSAGISKVYRFSFSDPNQAPVAILSQNLEAGQTYDPQRAGYALFDESMAPIAGARPATADMEFEALKPGTYYLKVVGPGAIHIKIH